MAWFPAAKAAIFCYAWFGNGASALSIAATLFDVLHVMLKPDRAISYLLRQLSLY
jgi:hypothetical protein